ncbi:hypothetical protein [Streptomyces yangpuensis]|uniref:hypothetical protein n=1 Tax=Streptomyces yangpuensis TaxID=1648182 RepID=UPI003677EC10
MTRLAGDLAEAAPAAYLAQDGRRQEGWTLVVTRRQDGAARSEVFSIAADTKLYARTDGQILQTFDPGKRLITIEARTADSTVAQTKGRPSLGDCATVKPEAWNDQSVTSYGDYCLITSEGRFGALHIGDSGRDCTFRQTAVGTQ